MAGRQFLHIYYVEDNDVTQVAGNQSVAHKWRANSEPWSGCCSRRFLQFIADSLTMVRQPPTLNYMQGSPVGR